MKLQLATVTITDGMPRWWRCSHGIAIRLPDYFPMGGRRVHLALTVLLLH